MGKNQSTKDDFEQIISFSSKYIDSYNVKSRQMEYPAALNISLLVKDKVSLEYIFRNILMYLQTHQGHISLFINKQAYGYGVDKYFYRCPKNFMRVNESHKIPSYSIYEDIQNQYKKYL